MKAKNLTKSSVRAIIRGKRRKREFKVSGPQPTTKTCVVVAYAHLHSQIHCHSRSSKYSVVCFFDRQTIALSLSLMCILFPILTVWMDLLTNELFQCFWPSLTKVAWNVWDCNQKELDAGKYLADHQNVSELEQQSRWFTTMPLARSRLLTGS